MREDSIARHDAIVHILIIVGPLFDQIPIQDISTTVEHPEIGFDNSTWVINILSKFFPATFWSEQIWYRVICEVPFNV